MNSIDTHIQALLEWTNEKVKEQQEPPWAMPQYEKLRATLVAIQQGRSATIVLGDLQQQELSLESALPQAENIVELDKARLRRGNLRLQLPM